jgi:hypothetical protein
MEFTQSQINSIVAAAEAAASAAAKKFYAEEMGGRDGFPCGFAWVSIYDVKGNTRLGKMLAAAGIRRNSYEKTFQMWNPSRMMVQNMYVLEEGSRAAAEVFKRHGFRAYAGSRMD